MALEGISSERAKHSTKFVDRRTARLPRDRPTARQRHATYDRKMGGIAPAVSSRSGGRASADPYSIDRPSVFRTAAPAPKKNNIFNASKRNNALAVPTKQLNDRATRVSQAPRSLIEEHRRPAEPAVARRPALRVPGRSGQDESAPSPSLQDRESRLRAIAAGRAQGSSQPRTLQSPRSGSARSSSSALPTSAESQSRTSSAARPDGYQSSHSGASMNPDGVRASPPRAAIRKRPASNPLMQPKKKRVH